MMVSIGCAIFVIGGLAVAGDHSEAVTRVIQGIASGIGFLGAGTILKLDQKQEIKGLTTASSIWLAAALGTTAGLAEYCARRGRGNRLAVRAGRAWVRWKNISNAGRPRIAASASNTIARKRIASRTTRTLVNSEPSPRPLTR